MTKHTLNPLLAYEPKVPKSPEPLHYKLEIRNKIFEYILLQRTFFEFRI